MFRQKFRWHDGRAIEIAWHEPKDGVVEVDEIDGSPPCQFTPEEQNLAESMVESRMAESGPHKDEPRACPHGNVLGECNACDVAGDLAYDTWREGR